MTRVALDYGRRNDGVVDGVVNKVVEVIWIIDIIDRSRNNINGGGREIIIKERAEGRGERGEGRHVPDMSATLPAKPLS